MQALKRWIPSLHERDINVILTAKGFTLDSLVSVISYDLAVRMAAELKARNYGAVITVRTLTTNLCLCSYK